MKTREGKKPRVSVVSAVSAGFGAGLIGLILTPILVNVLGGLAFHDDHSYPAAQGLDTLFFLSIQSAPQGALYWGIVGLMRETGSSRRIVLGRE